MKSSYPGLNAIRNVGVSAYVLMGLVLVVPVMGEDRSLEDFERYAAGKLPNLSEAELKAFARAVDANGDGKISDAEFARRGQALRKTTAQPGSTNDKRNESERSKAAAAASKKNPVASPILPVKTDATILLVAGDEIAAAWLPFAEWKTRGGKATKIISVSEIAKNYEADSIQEKIRLCVREHIEKHGTRWVILGGDSLPGGKGLVPGGHTTVHAQERAGIPTDIVYLSETNWDADGDGVFGEWQDDREAITYPDGSVGLGRIPVRTAADVAAFTEKVIAYESRYPTNDFAMQMIYTCTDSPAYPKVRKSWDAYVSKAWKDGEARRFFSQETPWDGEGKPGNHQLSARNLVELINQEKIGKFHIHGHGHLPAWVLERSQFVGKHVALLENDGAYPLITTVSCNTGEYDSATDPSIVERMIRKPKGGSVAIVAPIRTGKPHFHKRSDFRLMITEGKLDGTTQTMTRYWSNGLGKNLSTGEALMKAKAQMAEDARKSPNYHLCISELNLLGDPTLDMRSTSPRTPKVTVPEKIALGQQNVTVKTDAPGSVVCLWKGAEIYAVAISDKQGHAVLSIEARTAGKLLVGVSGNSLNVALASIIIEAKPGT